MKEPREPIAMDFHDSLPDLPVISPDWVIAMEKHQAAINHHVAELDQLTKKVSHGCTDATCRDCDGES